MRSNYRLAGHVISLQSQYPLVHRMCAPYQTEGAEEMAIVTTDADIAFEKERSAREYFRENLREGIPHYAPDYLETLAVYRKLAEAYLAYDMLLVHGSVVAVDGQAYLFTASSGTGKTTHTRLWLERFGQRAQVVNGDKPLLGIGPQGVTAYGTPWDGKEHLSSNIACPLKAICILTRGETNRIAPISKKDALPMLCQQTYRPMNPAALRKTLSLVDRLGGLVALYRLSCNMEPEAAQVAYDGMNR